MESWSLREEILKIINKWYLSLAFYDFGWIGGIGTFLYSSSPLSGDS